MMPDAELLGLDPLGKLPEIQVNPIWLTICILPYHLLLFQVKKRLDYQLELANMMRRMEQHMADWIMSNVRKSITAKQEDDALKKCIADLKTMAK